MDNKYKCWDWNIADFHEELARAEREIALLEGDIAK